jgi:hypothetical protein
MQIGNARSQDDEPFTYTALNVSPATQAFLRCVQVSAALAMLVNETTAKVPMAMVRMTTKPLHGRIAAKYCPDSRMR